MSARKIFIGIGIVGLAAFLWFFREDLIRVAGLIRGLNWQLLLLILPLQAFSYLCHALYYRSMLGTLGHKVGLWSLYKLSFGLAFTNMALPSAGLSSMSLLAYTLKKEGVPTGKSTFLQFARYAITYVSFLLLLFLAVMSLYFSDDIARITIRLIVMISTLVMIAGAVSLYAVYDKRAFDFLARKLQRTLDWFSRKLRGGKNLIGVDYLEQLLREFHKGFQEVLRRRVYMKQPLLWSLMASVVELLSLYVVFLALGFAINPGIVVLAYGASNVLGFLTVLPGDIGVYEVAMTSVLVTAGVPISVALTATLVYRVGSKVLLICPGFYFYNQLVAGNDKGRHKIKKGVNDGA